MSESRMQCMQVWGGSGVADAAVSTTGLDVCLYCKPCGGDREGGDVYYLSSCSSGRITRLVLADVRGHGEPVVWLSRILRQLVQRHIDHIDHGKLVRSINRAFVAVGEIGTFATGLIATFFVPTSTLSLTNAGHPPPLCYRAESRRWDRLVAAPPPWKKAAVSAAPADVPLGLFESTTYAKSQFKLGPNDLLLCFTDGLEECVDHRGEMLGPEGICRLVAGIEDLEPRQIVSEIVRGVTAMSEKNLTRDDVTILLVRPNGAPVPMRDNLLAPFRYLSNRLGLRS
jgi:sigma-B regulation protein RsbU (phosphoserine phosphatase)